MNNNFIYLKHFEIRHTHYQYWFSKSDELFYSAKLLWDDMEKTGLLFIRDIYLMLIGMSFETLIKAYYICLNKEYEVTHNLNKLFKNIGVYLKDEEEEILNILTNTIIWEGKYPSPKKKNKEYFMNQWKNKQIFTYETVKDENFGKIQKYRDRLSFNNLKRLRDKIIEQMKCLYENC